MFNAHPATTPRLIARTESSHHPVAGPPVPIACKVLRQIILQVTGNARPLRSKLTVLMCSLPSLTHKPHLFRKSLDTMIVLLCVKNTLDSDSVL